MIEFVDLDQHKSFDKSTLNAVDSVGFIKISLADKWDPEGYIKFEVNLPNKEIVRERNSRKGFEIIAIWQSTI